MSSTEIDVAKWRHTHAFGTEEVLPGERRTRVVIALTLVMMVIEIWAGLTYGSMALLADGWHMGTHVAALGVAAFAYAYARRHALDPRYSFGTGKVGALGAFASAVGLAIIALLIAVESGLRLLSPTAIEFDQSIAVAVAGLAVNLGSAWLLGGHHHHGHHHREHHHREHHDGEHAPHEPAHHHHERDHHDHNLRGAYLHVLADALTSALAIGALLAGKHLGWAWMDPAMGLVGALVIARWSRSLLREASGVLLDAEVSTDRRAAILAALETDGDVVSDLHVWRVGPQHFALIAAIVSLHPREPTYYRARLAGQPDLAHCSFEVHAFDSEAV